MQRLPVERKLSNTSTPTIPRKRRKTRDNSELLSAKKTSKRIRLNKNFVQTMSATDSDTELCDAAAVISPLVRLSQKKNVCEPAELIDLTEETSSAGEKSPGILKLPNEILQEIFFRVPIDTLFHDCAPVCRRFNEIISDTTYLRYRKLYFRYLYDRNLSENDDEYRTIFRHLYDDNFKPSFSNIVQLMADVEQLTAQEKNAASDALRRHVLYEPAQEILRKLNLNKLVDGVGSTMAVLILLSTNLNSVSTLIKTVTSIQNCKTYFWTEYFYCFALLLYEYSTKTDAPIIDGRLHYFLHYALYLFENDGGKTYGEMAKKIKENASNVPTQMSLDFFVNRRTKREPTYEQYRIITYDLRPDDCVRIMAFAGTGKTTTLTEYCRARPHMKFLVLFFNADVCADAKGRFEDNATCKTMHSVAHRHVGHRFRHKMNYGPVPMNEILDVCPPQKGLSMYVGAGLIRQTLVNFLASADEEIGTRHVPDVWAQPKRRKASAAGASVNILEVDFDKKLFIAKETEKVWSAMTDPNCKLLRMVHDGYLKLFQLSRKQITGYDCILVDEAQDCTPATIDIVQNQSVPKILVGDSYQQIYSFRGAVDALQKLPSTKTFYLTQSFRFGPEIAYVANVFMRSVLGERKKFLLGTGKPSRLDECTNGQIAIICRTNAGVFDECAELAARGERLFIVNGQKPYDFASIECVYYLYLEPSQRANEFPSRPRHKFLDHFDSLKALDDYACETDDKEWLAKLAIVEKYKMMTLQHVQRIKRCVTGDSKTARYLVTTAHKAKGLEFKNVRLANDFADLDLGTASNSRPNSSGFRDEKNLLYVAITRAMDALILNKTVWNMLTRRNGALFFSPAVGGEGENSMTCNRCNSGAAGKIFLKHAPLAITQSTAAKGLTYLRCPILCAECVKIVMESPNLSMKYSYSFFDKSNNLNETASGRISVNFPFFYPILH